jgi:hypothetical protein
VTFEYHRAPGGGALRQTEILSGVDEYRVVALDAEGRPEYLQIRHPLAIIVGQDCDLEQDHTLRFEAGAAVAAEAVELLPNSLAQVVLCDAYPAAEIKARLGNFGRDDRKRLVQNENERYHYLEEATIGGDAAATVEAIFFDFRKHFSLPTAFLYDRLAAAGVGRVAVMAPVYSHDLVQRFFNYQSRVALI